MKRLATAMPPVVRQYLKFGLVGVMATLTHSLLFVALVEQIHLQPLLSNLVAFACAFSVSYVGNRSWTFAAEEPQSRSIVRFFVVSLFGLCLNSLFIALVTHVFGSSYLYSLPFMIGVVPVAVFLLNKHWTFSR